MSVTDDLKTLLSNLYLLIKLYLNINPLYDKPIPDDVIILDRLFDSKYVTENFNAILSIYGLNPKSHSNLLTKLWGLFWNLCFCFGFFRTIYWSRLDSFIHYKTLIYTGDITLIFKSFREYFLVFILMMASIGIHINRLFNFDKNTKW